MRGCVSLVFDDGYEKIYKDVVPLLRQYTIPATFAIPLENETIHHKTQQPLTPWHQWLPLTQEGHEIAAHSVSHTDLTRINNDQLERELAEPATTLQAHTLVYPGGAHNDHVVALTKRYYQAARTVRKGFETLPPQDPFRLKSFDFTRDNFWVGKANALALYAYLTGSWLIETYHMVADDTPTIRHYVPLQAFAKHLAFLYHLPVAKKTINQVIHQ